MAGLEISVGANIKDFQNKIKEVENDVQQLANEKAIQIKLGLDTKLITSQIRDAKKHLNDLKQTARDTGQSFQKDLAPKVANGGNALMQFSRIAQDAPFGIMGIGNNITATVEAFGHLRQSTGSAGGALKAVASSILGSGGILLAVSLVTSGLTYMSQNGLTVGDVFRKLTGDFDQSRRSMQELSVETAKNAQAQMSSVGAYVAAAKNINLSMEDRLIAVKKLQDEYPAYFGNLSKEQILNGNVANAVRGVTTALIAKAKAASMVGRIVKLAEEEEQLQNDLNNEILSTVKAYALTNKEAFIYAKAVREGADAFKLLEPYKKRAGFFDVAGALASTNAISNLRNEIIVNKKEQDRLTNSINESTAAYIKLETTKEKTGKSNKNKKIDIDYSPDIAVDPVYIFPKEAQENKTVLDIIKKSLSVELDKLKNNPIKLNIPIQNVFDSNGITAETIAIYKTLQKFNEDCNALITGSISQTFSQLGNSIGEALAQGKNVFSAIGQSLLNSLGAFLSDMGKLLIQYGTLAIAKGILDEAILVPGAGIVAGAAAIAVGVALSAAGGALSNRAKQGASGSSVSTGASYNSPGSSTSYGGASASSGSFNGTVVFEISGTSLIGVLSNSLDRNSRLGGALGI